jgi:hypothetical protein
MSKAENKGIRGYRFCARRMPGHSDILPEYAVGRINLPSTEMSGDADCISCSAVDSGVARTEEKHCLRGGEALFTGTVSVLTNYQHLGKRA